MTSAVEKSRLSGGDPGAAAERLAKNLLAGVDGRLPIARRYRDVCRALLAARPDANEPLIHVMRKAATLICWTERQDEILATGGEIDLSNYNAATNTLRRLLADIGFQPGEDPLASYAQGPTIDAARYEPDDPEDDTWFADDDPIDVPEDDDPVADEVERAVG